MARRILFVIVVLLLFVAGLLPVLSMLVRSFSSNGHFSLVSYSGILTSKHQWMLMAHSIVLALLVTFLSVGVGTPLGLLLGKTDLPFRRGLTALFVVPLLIPPYILAVSWFDLAGREGILAHLFGTSVSRLTSRYLFGLPGCVLVLFSVYLPVPMLLTIIFLRTINPRLEEAGRLASPWGRVLREITIPLILPGLLFAAMLVFLLSFGEFSVPAFLRYDVFPVESFTQFSAFYNFKSATAAALPLAAVTLIILLIETAFLREKTYQLRPFTGGERQPAIELGPARGWAFIAAVGFAGVLVILPVVTLLVRSGGIEVYAEALQKVGDSLVRSMVFAGIGATFLTFLGFFTGYLVQTRGLMCWRFVDSLTIFLFALPGTVIGIGLISLWNTPWTNFIYRTPAIIVLGYLARYVALTSRISVAQLALIPPSMEEAAQVAGAGWFRRVLFIVIPLARRGLLAGWLVGYIFCLRDIGISMLVYPPGRDTLPVRTFTLMANGAPDLIAALCIVMIAATLLPAGILWLLPRFAKRTALP